LAIQQRSNFYVVTRCSGGGKSSVVDGFPCVDEPGREIVKQTVERTRSVFFDRGLPEVFAARLLGIPVPHGAQTAVTNYRYAHQVFVMPPWPELFKNDEERRPSFDDALIEYPLKLEAYHECGYQLIEVPKASVADRVKFIVQISLRPFCPTNAFLASKPR
jgi:predicted ATPase